jgi:uncharacterized protein
VKHGISFKEASETFFDPFNLTIPDPDHSIEEERFILLGFGGGKLLVVSFTERDDHIRIISCRKANSEERRLYEQSSRR